jgi:hypothetical protein
MNEFVTLLVVVLLVELSLNLTANRRSAEVTVVLVVRDLYLGINLTIRLSL